MNKGQNTAAMVIFILFMLIVGVYFIYNQVDTGDETGVVDPSMKYFDLTSYILFIFGFMACLFIGMSNHSKLPSISLIFGMLALVLMTVSMGFLLDKWGNLDIIERKQHSEVSLVLFLLGFVMMIVVFVMNWEKLFGKPVTKTAAAPKPAAVAKTAATPKPPPKPAAVVASSFGKLASAFGRNW